MTTTTIAAEVSNRYYPGAGIFPARKTIANCTICGIPFITHHDIDGGLAANICNPCAGNHERRPHVRRRRIHAEIHTAAGSRCNRRGFGGAHKCHAFQTALRIVPNQPLYQYPPEWQTPANPNLATY